MKSTTSALSAPFVLKVIGYTLLVSTIITYLTFFDSIAMARRSVGLYHRASIVRSGNDAADWDRLHLHV